MDKNNDIQVNKVSKWDKGIAEESLWQAKKSVDAFLYGYSPMLSIEALDAVRTIYVYLDEALDHFNELEAKHNTDCGLISDYAEENAQLKLKNEKASNNIRELRQALAENDIVTCIDPITGSWGVGNVALQKKTEHFNIQLDNLRERLKITERSRDNWHAKWTELSDICSRNEDDYEMLQRMLEKDGYTVEYDDDIDDETVHCRCTSDDILKGTTPDEVTLQFGRWTLKRPQTFSEAEANAKIAELRARLTESEFDFVELKKEYEFQKEKNMELASKNRALGMEISERCKQIHELKDTLEKDRELAKLVGENVVECIKYGAEHGYYEVHPLNRFDIHIEETHVGSIQDRHAIPKIVVRCNNVWTEMERDTAQHECEELNEKVDRLWRVNEELNRKIKGLEKETNKSLSCPVACECENFKPKVHHSYDPLDDLPDMEHS